MKNRIIALLLILLMIAPTILSCGNTPAQTTEKEQTSSPESDSVTESELESEAETKEPIQDLVLIENKKYLCSFIAASHSNQSREDSISALGQMFIYHKISVPSVSKDTSVDINDGLEVLVGATNRQESKDAYAELSQCEYIIRVDGNKVVIIGFTDELTKNALSFFVSEYLMKYENNKVTIPGDLSIHYSSLSEIVVSEKPAVEYENVSTVGDKITRSAQTWLANEIEFTSSKDYTDPVYTVEMDAIFRNKDTGRTMSVPAFWDGGRSWKVRFALPEVGTWEFYTKCSDTENEGLHHLGGEVSCTAYTGDLDIYKHGFIKTELGKNYFMYDDGTPFFYLADTHFTLAIEDIDSYGSTETQGAAGITQEIAEQYGVTSMFEYIMDYRVEQGYTVIHSQPLTWWKGIDQIVFTDETGWHNIFETGVTDNILAQFQNYDRYFQYIAEVGLVHSNTQFSYPTSLMSVYFAGGISDEQLEKLCRYWVARYSAYPVMWATTQEGDNDYYGEDRGDCEATPETNPWKLVIEFVHKHDTYDHPSTCHQEHTSYTCVDNSTFGTLPSHTWYAAQYNNNLSGANFNWEWAKEFYNNPGAKPVVNYEGRYDHFWTGTDGSRRQGWAAYMNGQVGYGYGAQPIWSIFWAQNGIEDYPNHTDSDEYGSFDMGLNWIEGLYLDAGQQVTYIKKFLEQFEWWNLVPVFEGNYFYKKESRYVFVSTISNEVYLGYFYGTGTFGQNLGSFTNMQNAEYKVQWMNCLTGEFSEPFTITVTDGTYDIPAKPDDGEWAISVSLIKN